jgi:transposase
MKLNFTSLSNIIPDLNTIEQFWSVLEARVRNRFPPPTSLKQLEGVLQEEWYRIPL